jgi:PAS domain S-box-containing protein
VRDGGTRSCRGRGAPLAAEELHRRDAILEAVRFAAEHFLSNPADRERGMEEVLERLGKATETSRVYVFQNHPGEDGVLWNAQLHKWMAPGVAPRVPAGPDGSPITNFPYRDDGAGRWTDFGRWEEILGRGEPMYGNTRNFPEHERSFLGGTLGIRSMILVPIFVEGTWWGFIGFDDCKKEREWSVAEIDALKAAASTLGAALERQAVEGELRASETRYRAVIEQATENICLVDVETKRIVESNSAFRAALGYTEEELRGMTLYDVVAHDPESIDRNVRRTLQEGRSSIGQREYRHKDGSLLEVEASGSIIFRNGRETMCVVAHDVTERARAQRLLEERVATLSRIAANLAFDLPTEDTLNVLAESAVNASTAVACAVVLVDSKDDTLHLFGSYGLPEGYTAGLQEAYRAGAPSPSLQAFRTREPVLVRDLRRFLREDPRYAPVHRFVREVPWDIVYSLPLVSRDRAVGAIFFCYLPGEEPGEEEKVFLKAVADQTAVAIENARLFAEARGKAALEERQRLARELHDSVSQALYGIALGTKTARTLVKRNPDQAADPLDYVLSLAEAGLAEMRALIFELRPESLETEGLVAALEKQAAALRARHEIAVETSLCDEPEAPPEVKEAIYRIAQEALHNTVKHARAGKVELTMGCGPRWIDLEVSDDGVGFDAHGDFPGHLGLRSMRERAQRLGGTLKVEATLGSGTTIRAHIPTHRSDALMSGR